jgi:hypothetical protein
MSVVMRAEMGCAGSVGDSPVTRRVSMEQMWVEIVEDAVRTYESRYACPTAAICALPPARLRS